VIFCVVTSYSRVDRASCGSTFNFKIFRCNTSPFGHQGGPRRQSLQVIGGIRATDPGLR